MPHQDYFINGEKIPSVTEIVGVVAKPYLDGWKRRVGFEEADRIMNESADLGRTAHDLIDQYLSGKQVVGDSKAHELFRAWLKWWKHSGFTVVTKEEHLVSEKYKVHGSLDVILE